MDNTTADELTEALNGFDAFDLTMALEAHTMTLRDHTRALEENTKAMNRYVDYKVNSAERYAEYEN